MNFLVTIRTSTETLEKLKTLYKDDAIKGTQEFDWFSRFKRGKMLINDKTRSGRPFAVRIDENFEIFEKSS